MAWSLRLSPAAFTSKLNLWGNPRGSLALSREGGFWAAVGNGAKILGRQMLFSKDSHTTSHPTYRYGVSLMRLCDFNQQGQGSGGCDF